MSDSYSRIGRVYTLAPSTPRPEHVYLKHQSHHSLTTAVTAITTLVGVALSHAI